MTFAIGRGCKARKQMNKHTNKQCNSWINEIVLKVRR